MIILFISEIFALAVLLVIIYFIARPMVHGAIYFPTSTRNIETIVRLAQIKPGQKIVDLGSGDGRILIALARAGAIAIGYEINPALVRSSRRAIARAGLSKNVTVHWKSFWRADLSQYDTVVVYGIPYIMNKLSKKMERELKPGTKIVSNIYSFHRWKPVAKDGEVYLYEVI